MVLLVGEGMSVQELSPKGLSEFREQAGRGIRGYLHLPSSSLSL